LARAEGAGQSVVAHLLARVIALRSQIEVLYEHSDRFMSLARLHGGVS
jgi:hypothetical protein